MTSSTWVPENTTVAQLWQRQVMERADREFLVYEDVDASEVSRFTYREFDARVNTCANALVEAGSRVALYLHNCVEFVECTLALAKMGAIAVPVDATSAPCELGRIMARTVQEGIDLFGDELDRHVSKRSCPAGECKAFMTYHILVSRCTGCGDCLAACEEDAITGKDKFVHVIDQKACIQCGRCLEACGEGAVVMAGARKPKTPPRPIPCKRS